MPSIQRSRRPPNLQDLPPEVLTAIFSEFQTCKSPPFGSALLGPQDLSDVGMASPADLLSLCLVSRKVYSVATVLLHENVARVLPSLGPRGSELQQPSILPWHIRRSPDDDEDEDEDAKGSTWHSRLLQSLCLPSPRERFCHTKALFLSPHPSEVKTSLEILKHIPHVTTVSLHLPNLSSNLAECLPSYFVTAPRVQTLSIRIDTLQLPSDESQKVRTLEYFAAAINVLPNLVSLKIHTVRSNVRGMEAGLQLPTHQLAMGVKNLSLVDESLWILSLMDRESVHTLRLTCAMPGSPKDYSPVLALPAHGRPFSRLETLQIPFATIVNVPNLDHFTSLRRVYLAGQSHSASAFLRALPSGVTHFRWLHHPAEAYDLVYDSLLNPARSRPNLSSICVDIVKPANWAYECDEVGRGSPSEGRQAA